MKIRVLPKDLAAVALNGEGGQQERPSDRNGPVGVQMSPLVHQVAPPHKTGPQSPSWTELHFFCFSHGFAHITLGLDTSQHPQQIRRPHIAHRLRRMFDCQPQASHVFTFQ